VRLVYFGTPDFASRCLGKIYKSKHKVVAVVTAPDKPKGRGMKLEPSEVKQVASRLSLDILQPENLKDKIFLEKLSSYKAELFAVVAFRILPEEVFTMPQFGTVNLHASLLPKYRGAAPINWAIFNGEKETGLSTFFIRKKVDTGDMLLQEKIDIGPDETFGELHARMATLGGDLFVKTLELIESGNYKVSTQDNSLATTAPKLTPELGNIDWFKSASDVHNLVRGLCPRPGAYSYRNGKKIIILRTCPEMAGSRDAGPGMIIEANPQRGLVVACGDAAVRILQIRPESGKTISGEEYVRGYRPVTGEKFERKID
jgi:methionyl-tRNA formyltransferase